MTGKSAGHSTLWREREKERKNQRRKRIRDASLETINYLRIKRCCNPVPAPRPSEGEENKVFAGSGRKRKEENC